MTEPRRAAILARAAAIEAKYGNMTDAEFTAHIIADARRKGTLKEHEPDEYPVASMREFEKCGAYFLPDLKERRRAEYCSDDCKKKAADYRRYRK